MREKKAFKHMKAHESLFVPLKPNNDERPCARFYSKTIFKITEQF
jgi:hypothetical protein